jgi:hypothetical protein
MTKLTVKQKADRLSRGTARLASELAAEGDAASAKIVGEFYFALPICHKARARMFDIITAD